MMTRGGHTRRSARGRSARKLSSPKCARAIAHRRDCGKGGIRYNIKNTYRFAIYDAKCKETNTHYEIKARRCAMNSYPTTIIPYSKIAKKEEKDNLIFVFLFTDGLYYIKYNQDLFNTFETKNISYHRSGCATKPILHYCIPCELLSRIII